MGSSSKHSQISFIFTSGISDNKTWIVAFERYGRQSLSGKPGRDCLLALNDIRDGIPKAIARGLDGNVLIVANMPFGPAPNLNALPLTSNGGKSGADLQIAAYDAVAGLGQSAKGRLDPYQHH